MLQRRPRKRHPAGEDRTDPSSVMKPLVEAMQTLRIAISQKGEEEKEETVALEIAAGKNAREREESETNANGTLGG